MGKQLENYSPIKQHIVESISEVEFTLQGRLRSEHTSSSPSSSQDRNTLAAEILAAGSDITKGPFTIGVTGYGKPQIIIQIQESKSGELGPFFRSTKIQRSSSKNQQPELASFLHHAMNQRAGTGEVTKPKAIKGEIQKAEATKNFVEDLYSCQKDSIVSVKR